MNFDYNSIRARKARIAGSLTSLGRMVLVALAFVMIMSGVLLAKSNSILGMVLAGVGVWLTLPVIWHRYDLSQLKPSFASSNLEESLETELVGRLRSADTPADLWQAIRGTNEQNFFSLRLGIPPELIEQLLPGASSGVEQIISNSRYLSEKHGLDYISTGSLLASLLVSIPNYSKLLAEFSLTIEDLEGCVDWLAHHQQVQNRIGQHQQFGGLARNWTAGFTPLLNHIGHNMSDDVQQGGYWHRDLSVHSKTVKDMIPMLGQGRRNVVLVGDLGSGKTTTVFSLAQAMLTNPSLVGDLYLDNIVMLDASTLIARADKSMQLESLLHQVLAEAGKAKNIVLFFYEASLFFSHGECSIDIANTIEPLVNSGAVPLIFALGPTEWQKLKQQHKSLASKLNMIKLIPPSQQATMQILEDQTIMLEARHGVRFMYQSLKEAQRLSDQYMHEIAMPGRAIKLLEMSVGYADNTIVSKKSVQVAVESSFGVKVRATTQSDKQELLNLEDKIHTRMINQNRAVKVVADALRRAQSGIGNKDKPVGTFLFLGPTGVGKTQMAKAVAAEYFSGDDAIVRLDMNEYVQAQDVSKLTDSAPPQSLLAQIQRNPFSVVLLDEIEKASPQVINSLLQMLDEGKMSDSANRSYSFRDAIIIATSNAGADKIRHYIEEGREVKEFETDFIGELIDTRLFKPEFINRFDESVVFRPLKPLELLRLVDMLLAGINESLSDQQVTVKLTNMAKKWLVDEGYDARLGARPLRRTVQRSVENIVAKRLLSSESLAGQTITLDVADLEEEVGE